MITLSPTQLQSLYFQNKLSQLKTHLPMIVADLKTKYPEFSATKSDEEHNHHVLTTLTMLANHHFLTVEQLQSLIGLQYETRRLLYDEPMLKALLSAVYMNADDRISALHYANQHPEALRHDASILLYGSMTAEAFSHLVSITQRQALHVGEMTDPEQLLPLQLKRHAVYYHLLSHRLHGIADWEAAHSDWQQGRLSVVNSKQHRAVCLQPYVEDEAATPPAISLSGAVHANMDDSTKHPAEPPTLCLSLKDRFGDADLQQIYQLLTAWIHDLQPLEAMQSLIKGEPHA